MRSKIYGLMLGVVLLLVLGGQASAATKVIEIRTGFDTVTFDVTGFACGSVGTFPVIAREAFSFTLWDNGHYKLAIQHTGHLFDSTGTLLLANAHITIHEVAGEGGLPLTFQFNFVLTCTPESSTPGRQFTGHTGITVSEDGTLQEEHTIELGTPPPTG